MSAEQRENLDAASRQSEAFPVGAMSPSNGRLLQS